jgi:hypothetical protein
MSDFALVTLASLARFTTLGTTIEARMAKSE